MQESVFDLGHFLGIVFVARFHEIAGLVLTFLHAAIEAVLELVDFL